MSWFVYYYHNEPKLIGRKELVDEYPMYTNAFKSFYVENVLGGIEPKWSYYDEQNFIDASIKTHEFFCNNIKKIDRMYTPNPYETARLVWEAIKFKNYNISKITSGYFCSESLFNRDLPAYLHSQAIINE